MHKLIKKILSLIYIYIYKDNEGHKEEERQHLEVERGY